MMAADQGGDVHRAGELGVAVARVAKHHDEGVDLDGRAVGLGITADLGPVALGLLAGGVSKRTVRRGSTRCSAARVARKRRTILTEPVKPCGIAAKSRTAERWCACQRSTR